MTTNLPENKSPDNRIQNQRNCIDNLQGQGYNVDAEGACFGIAHMGMQAFLADPTMSLFNARLKCLQQSSQPFEKKMLEENFRIEIMPFLDGIALYQKPEAYSELFAEPSQTLSQDAQRVLPIVMPVKFDKDKTKQPTLIIKNYGAYTQSELANYLNLLKAHNPDKSFALILGGNQHCVNLNYRHDTSQWMLVNHDPAALFTDTTKLSNHLVQRFAFSSQEEGLVLATHVYAHQEDKIAITQAFESLRKNHDWKQLHTPLKFGKTFHAQKGLSPLIYAVLDNNAAWLSESMCDMPDVVVHFCDNFAQSNPEYLTVFFDVLLETYTLPCIAQGLRTLKKLTPEVIEGELITLRSDAKVFFEQEKTNGHAFTVQKLHDHVLTKLEEQLLQPGPLLEAISVRKHPNVDSLITFFTRKEKTTYTYQNFQAIFGGLKKINQLTNGLMWTNKEGADASERSSTTAFRH